jgi:hypothetical protein
MKRKLSLRLKLPGLDYAAEGTTMYIIIRIKTPLLKSNHCTLLIKKKKLYVKTKDIYTKLSSMQQLSLSCQNIIAVDIATQAE